MASPEVSDTWKPPKCFLKILYIDDVTRQRLSSTGLTVLMWQVKNIEFPHESSTVCLELVAIDTKS